MLGAGVFVGLRPLMVLVALRGSPPALGFLWSLMALVAPCLAPWMVPRGLGFLGALMALLVLWVALGVAGPRARERPCVPRPRSMLTRLPSALAVRRIWRVRIPPTCA